MALSETSTLVKVAFVSCCFGLVLHIVGLSTDHWLSYADGLITIGLWADCGSICPDFIQATRSFGIIGCLVGVIALCMILFAVLRSSSKVTQVLSFLLAGGAAACILLCVIIYGSKIHDLNNSLDLFGWSFGLCCAGGVLYSVAAILLLIKLLCN